MKTTAANHNQALAVISASAVLWLYATNSTIRPDYPCHCGKRLAAAFSSACEAGNHRVRSRENRNFEPLAGRDGSPAEAGATQSPGGNPFEPVSISPPSARAGRGMEPTEAGVGSWNSRANLPPHSRSAGQCFGLVAEATDGFGSFEPVLGSIQRRPGRNSQFLALIGGNKRYQAMAWSFGSTSPPLKI
jgi:hypothetical protein